MTIQDRINYYLKRKYIIDYNVHNQILTIKNKIHVYELLMLRTFIFRNGLKVKDIRVEG